MAYDGPVLQGVRGTVQGSARSSVDCREPVAGRIPSAATVRMSVVTAAGRTHVQSLPVDPVRVREVVLEACRLPDPLVRPMASGDVQGTQVALELDGVPRARTPLYLQEVTGPGLRVTVRHVRLPTVLLAVVRDGTTTLRLPVTQTALSLPGPQHLRTVTPLTPYLRALVARRCS